MLSSFREFCIWQRLSRQQFQNRISKKKLSFVAHVIEVIFPSVAALTTDEITLETLLREVDFRRVEATARLNPARRSDMGQFMTPGVIAEFMATLFCERPEALLILDAACCPKILRSRLV